jgi:hypothetical protein
MRGFLQEETKGEKLMTIQEAMNKATAGGYHLNGSDGMETSYEGASNAYTAWTRKDNASTFMVAVEETFLDPEFWRSLGRALGWDLTIMTVHTVENGRPTLVTRSGQHWVSQWHRFIDFLADGKTTETSRA